MDNNPRSLLQLLNEWHDAVSGTIHPKPPNYTGSDVSITKIVEHTGHVEPGAVFVARVRTGSDGHPYIGQAVALGASLIIGQKAPHTLEADLGNVPYLQVDNSALVEAWLAAAFYGFPTRQLVTIGVTGTDGKTTTAILIQHILLKAGLRTGLLSTLKADFEGREESLALHVTTPEAPVVQAYLRKMVDQGITHCVLETTSHGLAQDRLAAVAFDAAVVTNVTHEHLDYHRDYTGYLAAKSKLFLQLVQEPLCGTNKEMSYTFAQKTAFLNADDGSFSALAALPVPHTITYGLHAPSDVMAKDITTSASGTSFSMVFERSRRNDDQDAATSASVKSPLIGAFNVYNMLAASAVTNHLGIAPATIAAGLNEAPHLTGRMERIERGQHFEVIVDFAHTPNGLEQAILSARELVSGRLITVFGSAGKRDKEKRRSMAEISARLADLTVLTAEDPRTDSLEEILDMMASGCEAMGGQENVTFWRIPDRGQAIFFALHLAEPEDLVLVCGKGHEQSMCFGTTEFPWDDINAVNIALDSFLAGQKMPDLGLPTFDPDQEFIISNLERDR